MAVVLSCVSYRVVDADALMRLALGRYLLEHELTPAHDPFVFSAPDARWVDPEWLGDIALYWLYSGSSELQLQLAVVALACFGYSVAYALAIELGSSAAVAASLLACTVATTAPRISARNDVHLLWLVPACVWLVRRASSSLRCYAALWAMLWLWSQLHSSFVLSLWIIGAGALAEPSRPTRLWALLALVPGLPFLGLSGSAPYLQLYDHLFGAAVYRSSLSEWMSPLTSQGWLAVLPLHVFALLGATCLVRARATVQPLALALFVLGIGLAYTSRRFLPMLACACVPGMAGWVTAALSSARPRTRAAFTISGVLLVVVYSGVTLRSAQRRAQASVFADETGPHAAVRHIAQHAPLRSRVFNAFDAGPWLMWLSRPDMRHFIDPRNHLGAAHLARYRTLLANPAAFESAAQRDAVDLVLLPNDGPAALAQHLAAAGAWKLVYWDGTYSTFVRVSDRNRAWLDAQQYRVLRPTLDLRYLTGSAALSPALQRDLAQLEATSQPLAQVIRAYLVLRTAAQQSPATQLAAAQIAQAWPLLPEPAPLARALAELPLAAASQ
jgi:hypothetical protein